MELNRNMDRIVDPYISHFDRLNVTRQAQWIQEAF